MRNMPLYALALSLLIVGSCSYLASGLSTVSANLALVTDQLTATPTRIIYQKDTEVKTGSLSKIFPDGTSVSLDYTWDCTTDDWRRIMALWKIICDNPPGGEAAKKER